MAKEHIINSAQALEAYKKHLDAQFAKHKYLRVTLKNGKQRTTTQNAAMHKFFENLANTLNDAGIDFRVFIKAGYPVPFTPDLVKDHIWRPVQKAVTGHESTTKPKTHEYSIIYDCINVKLTDHEIYEPWPCKESKEDFSK